MAILTIYNTLTGQKEPFVPSEGDHARIYVCGPTVYDYAHLGHARCYVVYDVLVRYLRENGLKVTYVRNVTDVDDKILKRAVELNEDPARLAKRFTDAYRTDMRLLGNVDPDIEPCVTHHIPAVIALIERLINKQAAYVSSGSVYFRVHRCTEYGKLSHRKIDDMEAGASGRVTAREEREKESPLDFALWKHAEPTEPGWDSPWGRGRPGWHIECSAMSMAYLGETFDLHGGGLDLVFPHHENEIAQSETATGKTFARYWMHNGFVEVDKQKMSKSLGNFFTARELFHRVEPEAVRYVMLTVHYRAPLHLDWTLDEQGSVVGFPQFEEAERRIEYLYFTRERLRKAKSSAHGTTEISPEIRDYSRRLRGALADDLNMPVALAATSEFLKHVNDLLDRTEKKKHVMVAACLDAIQDGFDAMTRTLGIGYEQEAASVLSRIRARRVSLRGLNEADIEQKIEARIAARQQKDYARADAIRAELAAVGVILMDGPSGTDWRIS